jgi:hypothetical protein
MGGPSLCVVLCAVWLVPRTRAALVLVIRDDIVEMTHVMESSRRELRRHEKFHRCTRVKKVAVLLGNFCALRINPSQQCAIIVESGDPHRGNYSAREQSKPKNESLAQEILER